MLVDQIREDLTKAMKAGDSVRTSTLRLVLSEINYKKIEFQKELDDDDVAGVIKREVKKRREAIESYIAGGRGDQAAVEQKEMEILLEYAPKQMTEEEIKAELKSMNLPRDFAGAMKIAASKMKGRADGSVVANMVRELTA